MNNTISLEKKLIVYRYYIARYILNNRTMDSDSFSEAKEMLLTIQNLIDNKTNDNLNENMEQIKKYVIKTKKVDY